MSEKKDKLQKYTIGYMIAGVAIFVIVLFGVSGTGVKALILIAIVGVFVVLILVQKKRGKPVSIEDIPAVLTEEVSQIFEGSETAKEEKKPEPKPIAKEAAETKDKVVSAAKKTATKAKSTAKKAKAKTTAAKKTPAKKAPAKKTTSKDK